MCRGINIVLFNISNLCEQTFEKKVENLAEGIKKKLYIGVPKSLVLKLRVHKFCLAGHDLKDF